VRRDGKRCSGYLRWMTGNAIRNALVHRCASEYGHHRNGTLDIRRRSQEHRWWMLGVLDVPFFPTLGIAS
jgi:hypothetical protein